MNETTTRLSRIAGLLGLATAACLAGAGTCDAQVQHYVAPRPTADEVHWHHEFVRLFDSGHTHDAAAAAENLEHSLQGLNDAQGWYILGNDWNAIAEWDRAVNAFKRALALQPDNAAIINNLGMAYKGLGKYDLAMASYRRAAALGDDRARKNANELSQALAPPPRRAGPDMGDRIRAAQEQENLRRCGTYSC